MTHTHTHIQASSLTTLAVCSLIAGVNGHVTYAGSALDIAAPMELAGAAFLHSLLSCGVASVATQQLATVQPSGRLQHGTRRRNWINSMD